MTAKNPKKSNFKKIKRCTYVSSVYKKASEEIMERGRKETRREEKKEDNGILFTRKLLQSHCKGKGIEGKGLEWNTFSLRMASFEMFQFF